MEKKGNTSTLATDDETMSVSSDSEPAYYKELDEILDRYKPHESRETLRHGGIVDFEIKLTKKGFNDIRAALGALMDKEVQKAKYWLSLEKK